MQSTNKIHVEGIGENLIENDLIEYFQIYGSVNEIILIRTNEVFGYAFVTFRNCESVDIIVGNYRISILPFLITFLIA